MNRIWAIIERDLRRFRRSPTLVIVSMVMPLVQLIVLGYAFGGKVKHLQLGILDQDRGMPAIRIHEMAQAVAANAQTFESIYYNNQATALHDLHDGKISGLNGMQDDPNEYQISVPVQPGNSGGPLCDANGDVVGIIVARLRT